MLYLQPPIYLPGPVLNNPSSTPINTAFMVDIRYIRPSSDNHLIALHSSSYLKTGTSPEHYIGTSPEQYTFYHTHFQQPLIYPSSSSSSSHLMQPNNREMQSLNSLLNSSNSQIQMNDDNNNNNHFDPTSPHDDFLKQILSNLPSSSSSWTLDPNSNPKPLWDSNSDETNADNAHFQFEEQANLSSKFRNHQISDKAAALMLLMPQIPFDSSQNDVVDASSFKSPNPLLQAGDGSVQALYNGFSGSLHGGAVQPSNQTHHFQLPQGQNFGGSVSATNQAPASGAPAQPRQKVRARRGQATDPHSIAERLRRERIAERMKALQELVPNANKTDKASMLDEIIDYVKFLQVQVKVLSMSRLGGAAAVAPLVADMSSEGGGDCFQTNGNGGVNPRTSNNNHKTASPSNESLTMTEQQVAKLMEEDMGSAMQYLQGKGLCLMPISLATAISTATCHTRNPLINAAINNVNGNTNPVIASNGDGPLSPSMSVNSIVKDASSVSISKS